MTTSSRGAILFFLLMGAGPLACAGGSSGPASPPALDATGTWTGTLHSTGAGGDGMLLFSVSQQPDGKVSATLTLQGIGLASSSSYGIDGTVSASTLSLQRDLGGGSISITGTVASDFTASGTYRFSQSGSNDQGTWTAKRLPAVTFTSRQLFTMNGTVSAMTYDGARLWMAGYFADAGTNGPCTYSLTGTRIGCVASDPFHTIRCARMAYYDDGGGHPYILCGDGSGTLSMLNAADGTLATQLTYGDGTSYPLWFGECAYAVDASKNVLCFTIQAIDVLSLGAQHVTAGARVALPLAHPTGVATPDGTSFWVTDLMAGKFFKVDGTGQMLAAADQPPITSSQDLYAIAWDGAHLLAAVEDPSSQRTVVYELTAN